MKLKKAFSTCAVLLSITCFGFMSMVSAEDKLPYSVDDDKHKVFVMYDKSYNTKLYKCWEEVNSICKSGPWDGLTDNLGLDESLSEYAILDRERNVKNAAVVRRGTTIYVTDDILSIRDDTPVTILAPANPGERRAKVNNWTIETTTHSGTNKSVKSIRIPVDAPVGDYQIQIGDSDPENFVTVYVIFDPSWVKSSGKIMGQEYEAWVYNDSDIIWNKFDTSKDFFDTVYYKTKAPEIPSSFSGSSAQQNDYNTGIFGQRIVELSMSIHGNNTSTPFEAAIHAYEVVGQRIPWKDKLKDLVCSKKGNEVCNLTNVYSILGDSYLNYTATYSGKTHTVKQLDVCAAEKAALGLGWTDRLDNDTDSDNNDKTDESDDGKLENYIMPEGQCYNHASELTALLRSMGIPARATTTLNGAGWSGGKFHVWAEAAFENPEYGPLDSNWWKGIWWKLDSCDTYATDKENSHMEGNIAPIVIDGWGDYLLNGYNFNYKTNSDKPNRIIENKCHITSIANGSELDIRIISLDTDGYKEHNSYFSQLNPYKDFELKSEGHGYFLNSTQENGNYTAEGYYSKGNFISGEDDLPEINHKTQPGIVAGWGYMLYRIPVNGREKVVVQVTQGKEKVEAFVTKDEQIFTEKVDNSLRRFNLTSVNGVIKDTDKNGIIEVDTKGVKNLYVFVQLKDISSPTHKVDNKVAKYKISDFLLGDFNEDFIVDSADYTQLRTYLLGLPMNTSFNLSAADVNHDTAVDSGDYTLLRKYVLGIISEF